jgi:hypothetical protein
MTNIKDYEVAVRRTLTAEAADRLLAGDASVTDEVTDGAIAAEIADIVRERIDMWEEAQRVESAGDFSDGKRFSALLADGSVVRCHGQDGAETVAMQGKKGALFEYRHNYIEVSVNGEIVGLVWPQD